VKAVVLALAALALGGSLTACESSQEKSAQLERVAKRERAQSARRRALARRALSITQPSRVVTVTATDVVHSSEGAAAIVTLHNSSATALRALPIEITARDAAGATVYTNATPGLAAQLTTVALVEAHASTTWVEAQLPASPAPTSVLAKVGEGEPVSEALPHLEVAGVRLNEGEAEGSLVNRSHTGAREVTLDAIARRGGRVVAVGSAIVTQVEAGASAHFQAALIGDPRGAQLEVSVAGAA
jgi:hypothetical protein